MDYILGTDLPLFWNVSAWDLRHNLDHYLVLGCLRRALLREHSEYIGSCKWTPLRPPTTPTREDGLFASLRRAVPKPKAQDVRKTVCISEKTWILINERVSAHQDPARDQSLIWRLGRTIAEILK